MTPHDSEAFHKDNIDRITETFYDAFSEGCFSPDLAGRACGWFVEKS